ncbi:MAG: hypothetical protein FJY95_08225 [Candidatus Handelsmanbacteria bacterium]|nr:hypothetical protein [Candidatus Handelsmanbacteria bacterium]
MKGKGLLHLALAGIWIALGLGLQPAQGRALLVIGETDGPWSVEPGLTVDRRAWIEAAARRPESFYPQGGGLEMLDTSGTYIAPFLVTPDYNLSLGYLERGGWERTRIGERDKQFFRALDGDISTFFFFAADIRGYGSVWPTVDLGGVFPVNRILFYTHPDRKEQYADYFTLYLNDGDPAKLDRDGIPIWEGIRQETENKNPVVETVFPVRPVRYVSLLSQAFYSASGGVSRPKPWEIAEFEIYGEGYVPEASYVSEIIDISQVAPELPGREASWGRLHWQGRADPGARVSIRTRTGRDDDPNVYWWNTGRGDELSTLNVDGTPLNYDDYLKVPNTQRGPVTYDTENWSFWSPPYDFDQGNAGAPIVSPGPRRYLQFRVDFSSTTTAGSRLEALGFDFSKPPGAQAAVAEIFPREVAAGVDTTFTYFLRPTLGESDLGFDSLEIETFVRPTRVRTVRIEGQPVDLQVYPPELLDHGLVVHFPRFGPQDTQKLLEVVFDAKVVRYGTEFSGRIYDRERDEVRQLVDSGDATNAYRGTGVSVTMPFSDQIIGSVRVEPSLFTPNGDGINEQASISYALLNLTAPVQTSLIIYDLSGRQLRRVQQGVLQSGIFQWAWDGRTGDGALAPPGNYLYRILVKADARDAQHLGIIAVAY